MKRLPYIPWGLTRIGLVLLTTTSLLPADEPEAKKPLPLEIAGVTVTPHVNAASLRFRRDNSNSAAGARVQLFVRNTAPTTADPTEAWHSHVVTFEGQEAPRRVFNGDWSWQDTPAVWEDEETTTPPGALVVWSFNTATAEWGPGRKFTVGVTDWLRAQKAEYPVSLETPQAWISAATFLSRSNTINPDLLWFHVVNESGLPVQMVGARLYLPANPSPGRVLYPQPPLTNLTFYPIGGTISPGDKGCARAVTGPLPLTHAALEVRLIDHQRKSFSLWASLRIKRETFDISGGWVQNSGGPGNALAQEPFLKTLMRLHINTAHIMNVPGYTDQTGPSGLYTRYPLKFFGSMQPLASWDTDAMLPRIHAVEFLGEPQYAGSSGTKAPQEVWQALLPYARSRLATTVTLSDSSRWCAYAGLSDYPHFDAYRVSAPAADDWTKYDRWGKNPVDWGAPLETIGALCRSLREISRPAPIACWSQGPHYDWDMIGGRKRTSPTPDEIRLQAYHALASRVTSLYWFNLSLRSLVKFRDTLNELGRIGRETRMIEDFYLEGDAFRYQQVKRDGQPDWDLASVVSPRGALLFALDLDYNADRGAKVFEFKHPRDARFEFALPVYLRRPADVFRIDADGVQPVTYVLSATGVILSDRLNKVGIYVATPDTGLRARLERKRLDLIAAEQSVHFDPASNDKDFEVLQATLATK